MGVMDQRAYVRATMAADMLTAEEERDLVAAWKDRGDTRAMHRLIAAHARLPVSMARSFRGSAVAFDDLVQQGNLGLMRAAEKFDPENGARFSTYARWWIRAAMQEAAMRDMSMVRSLTNARQKRLYFALRRAVAEAERAAAARGETPSQWEICLMVAEDLDVTATEVAEMMTRLGGPDLSLDVPQSNDAEGGQTWLDRLPDDGPATEDVVLGRIETARRQDWLKGAIRALPAREREIVTRRHLDDQPATLMELGEEMGISKERVRQLEVRALERMRAQLTAA